MKKLIIKLLFLICWLFGFELCSQTIIHGYVEDQSSGERLIGVNILAMGGKGSTTNSFGFYSLTLTATDSIDLIFSHVGYQTQRYRLKALEDTELNIDLIKGIAIETISVSEKSGIPWKMDIPISQITKMPALFGEKDLLRSLQQTPGVQGGNEGSATLFVRGGSSDQNLILLDDIPLYYVNHIGGFVSVFNVDVVKSATLYKGFFPARYGGRLSSILDIRTKEGNNKAVQGQFSLGIISSKIALDGPLFSEKTTFMISLRRSLFDLFTRGIPLIRGEKGYSAGYVLQDLNGKISHTFSQKDRLFLSAYTGKDHIRIHHKLEEDTTKFKSNNDLNWGNKVYSLRWNHQWTPNLFSNLTVGYSKFFYLSQNRVKNEHKSGHLIGISSAKVASSIKDWSGKIDFDWYKGGHFIQFGGGIIQHEFQPTQFHFRQNSPKAVIDTTYGSGKKLGVETFLYVEDQYTWRDQWFLDLGLHGVVFSVDRKNYFSLQPRILLNYELNDQHSIYASWALMSQYIHLLSTADVGLPTDLWVPSTNTIPAERSNQWTVGYSTILKRHYDIKVNTNLFYKKQSDLLTFKEGQSFFSLDKNWAESVAKKGEAQIYGMEWMIEKAWGQHISGWIAYTWSKNNRTFREINQGRSYPYRYDRRHDISINFYHKRSKKFDYSLSCIFSTGQAVSIPTTQYDQYVLDWVPIASDYFSADYHYLKAHVYGQKNGYRMPTYHRLDCSFHFHKQKKWGLRTWSIEVYNVYSRRNAYYLYFDEDKQGHRKLFAFSLFPILPSISYSLRF